MKPSQSPQLTGRSAMVYGPEHDAVARLLVVEGEAGAVVADKPGTAGDLDPVEDGVGIRPVQDSMVVAGAEGV